MTTDRIYLIGFMGCGKSTIGKLLAKKIGFKFIDLDDIIENNEKQTISEIFENEGEDYFRKIEHKNLLNTTSFKRTVIATGGGTPCFSDNMNLINENGTSFFIQCAQHRILDRISNSKVRPLVAQKNRSELRNYIREMLKIRLAHYQQAHFKIWSRDNIEKSVGKIISQL